MANIKMNPGPNNPIAAVSEPGKPATTAPRNAAKLNLFDDVSKIQGETHIYIFGNDMKAFFFSFIKTK